MPLMPLRNFRLSWEQRKTLQERLHQRASVLREEVNRTLHARDAGSLGFSGPRADADDDAAGDLRAAPEVAALQRDSKELRDIDAALERLDSGMFGACEDCGAPIAWERLLAVPEVQRCTRCQAVRERGDGAPPRL